MANRPRVEKGIKIPARMIKYNFPIMEVNESFPVAEEEVHRVRGAASAYGRAHNMKFSVRMTDPGARTYRCWRIA